MRESTAVVTPMDESSCNISYVPFIMVKQGLQHVGI